MSFLCGSIGGYLQYATEKKFKQRQQKDKDIV